MSTAKDQDAPNRREREGCYEARDKYWDCLDSHGAPQIDMNICKEARKFFTARCSKQWVKYFDRRFAYTRFQRSQPLLVLKDESTSSKPE